MAQNFSANPQMSQPVVEGMDWGEPSKVPGVGVGRVTAALCGWAPGLGVPQMLG